MRRSPAFRGCGGIRKGLIRALLALPGLGEPNAGHVNARGYDGGQWKFLYIGVPTLDPSL